MDDFGEELESLYLAAPRLDISRHIGVSRPGSDEGAQEVCQKTTSFLDLPGELRNAIYSLALNRDPFRISIGFKYTTDLPRRDPDRGRPKPPYHGAYNGGLIRSATGTITRTAIKERWPALTQALPSLRREVLEVHYSENVFRMILRNFLDRRLCAQWVLERGRLLKALKEIKLQMPYLMRYAHSLVVVVAELDDGSIAIRTPENRFIGTWRCQCDLGAWVDALLQLHGRHPDYEAAREMDAGPVMEAVIKICEAAEWADALWELGHSRMTVGTKRRHTFGSEKHHCAVCGKDAAWCGWYADRE
ncbi:hypothetical protein LTR53_000011 [Teratosphaeriaceae sp. CCFEE 6253]|nr:hypothetical protein LTR53_000011 [Teratosphaeriaceae sp. CCFEE 6253]